MTWSCNKNDSTALLPENEAVAVQFNSNIGGIASLAKPAGIKPLVAGSTWEGSDAIGVFMVNNGTNTVRNGETNKKYVTANSSGNFAPDGTSNTVYYPMNGNKVDFIAYYPYTSSITSLGAYSVNVSTQTAPAAIDLLYAKATNSGNGYDKANTSPIALSFSHQLFKLTLNISAPAGSTQITPGDLTTMTVRIAGMNTQAQFNLANGTLGTASNVANITPLMVTAGAKYEAILLPGDFSGVSVTFGITAGNNPGDYVWNIPDGAFEAGKEYVYSVSFTGAPGDVSVTGVINPWEVVTPEIPLTAPADNAYISANLATFPIRFSWTEAPGIANYKLKFSPLNDFVTQGNFQEIDVTGDHYDLIDIVCENLLSAAGVNQNETIGLYWTVVPATAAEVRTYIRQITLRRAGPAAVLSTAEWTATADNDDNGAVANMFDRTPNTYWESFNNGSGYTAWARIDMQAVKKITEIKVNVVATSIPTNVQVYVSETALTPTSGVDPASTSELTKAAEWTVTNGGEFIAPQSGVTARYIYIFPRLYGGGKAFRLDELYITGFE
jgi:hypothetical protein